MSSACQGDWHGNQDGRKWGAAARVHHCQSPSPIAEPAPGRQARRGRAAEPCKTMPPRRPEAHRHRPCRPAPPPDADIPGRPPRPGTPGRSRVRRQRGPRVILGRLGLPRRSRHPYCPLRTEGDGAHAGTEWVSRSCTTTPSPSSPSSPRTSAPKSSRTSCMSGIRSRLWALLDRRALRGPGRLCPRGNCSAGRADIARRYCPVCHNV
jgi:hypothetical protein